MDDNTLDNTSNKALAFNSELDYLIILIEDDGNFKNRKIVIAEDLLENVLQECKIKQFKKLKRFQEIF